MEDRAKKAKENFQNGYNCSQSVFLAFSDLYGIDKDVALKMTTVLGGGFAGTKDLCGAVSAMSLVVGLENGTTILKDKEGKENCYDKANFLIGKFRKEHGSILCKHLKGLEESDNPINRKECCDYVAYCASLLQDEYGL